MNPRTTSKTPSAVATPAPSFLFDFDGTLVDSVYQHVLAWHEDLMQAGIELSAWRIHRRIGMRRFARKRALEGDRATADWLRSRVLAALARGSLRKADSAGTTPTWRE